MRSNGIYIALIISMALLSCRNQEKINLEHGAIARAYDDYLYIQDVTGLEDRPNPADSLNYLNDQINDWLVREILLSKAKSQLPEDIRMDIEARIREYEYDLYEFAYNGEIVRQKMDTTLTDSIITDYYDRYISNYLLDEAYLRFIYVKCDKKQFVKEVERWMKDSIDLYNLEDFCKEELQVCHLLPEQWVSLPSFLEKLADVNVDLARIRSGKAYMNLSEDKVHYLIRILEFRDKGQPAPLSFVAKDIRSIMLNKKKTEFLNRFHQDLVNSEMEKGNVKIFD